MYPIDTTHRSLLHLASEEGHIPILEWLSHRYPSWSSHHINDEDDRGWSPLYAAAANGHVRAVSWLVATLNADPPRSDRQGRSPLSMACNVLGADQANRGAVVALLVAMGCR